MDFAGPGDSGPLQPLRSSPAPSVHPLHSHQFIALLPWPDSTDSLSLLIRFNGLRTTRPPRCRTQSGYLSQRSQRRTEARPALSTLLGRLSELLEQYRVERSRVVGRPKAKVAISGA